MGIPPRGLGVIPALGRIMLPVSPL